MATAIEEKVKETLTCNVCYETLKDPRTLPCMHTYCCNCVDRFQMKNYGQEMTLSCPECRQVHKIPIGGVAKFQVNFTTRSLVDMLHSIQQAEVDNAKRIDELLKKGETLVKSLEQSIQSTHAKRLKMEQEADSVSHKLDDDMNLAIKAIHDNYTKNINLVAEKRALRNEQALAHLEHLHVQKATTESTMSQLRTVKQQGNNQQLSDMSQEIIVKSIELTTKPTITEFEANNEFQINRVKVFDDRILFGDVNIHNVSTIEQQLPSPTEIKKKTMSPKISRIFKKVMKNGMTNAQDLAVTNNGDIIVNGWQTPGHIYDSHLTLKNTFGTGFTNVTSKNNEILFTSDSDTVHIYNQDGRHNRDLMVPRLKSCQGIAVNSKEELVICDPGTKSVYHIDSSTGAILTKSKSNFNCPIFVAINSKDEAIVSDYAANCVVGMTRDGNELFRY
ncbi:unnamed protein product, partial [Owenia fusiformis]